MKNAIVILTLLIGAMCCGQDAFAKAESLFTAKDYPAAKVQFEALMKQGYQNETVLRRLGDIEALANRYENASNYYEKLLQLDPKNADYHFLYGGTLGLYAQQISKLDALSYIDDIKSHLKSAANLDPSHIEARWALVQFYCELPGILGGSLRTSRQYADELLEISPVDGYLAHGFIAEYDEEYKDAEAHYKKAVLTGGSMTTYKKLADLYEKKTKEYLKALVIYQEAYSKLKDDTILDEIARIKTEHDLVGD